MIQLFVGRGSSRFLIYIIALEEISSDWNIRWSVIHYVRGYYDWEVKVLKLEPPTPALQIHFKPTCTWLSCLLYHPLLYLLCPKI